MDKNPYRPPGEHRERAANAMQPSDVNLRNERDDEATLLWLYVGAFLGMWALMVSLWVALESSAATSIEGVIRGLGASLAGAALLAGVFGTAAEISSKEVMNRLRRHNRSRMSLVAYGVGFSLLAASLSLGSVWASMMAIDLFPAVQVRLRPPAYIAAGLLAVSLSSALAMRLLARVDTQW